MRDKNMGRLVYVVEPFMGSIKGKQNAKDVSKQLQELINAYAKKGWQFHSVAEVNISVAPGCLAGLLGGKNEYTKYDQVVFCRPLTEEEEAATPA